MPLSLLLLLLHCLLPVDCMRPPHKSTIKPTTNKITRNMRLPKSDDGAKHTVIDFSDDNDHGPDSYGEYTRASLTKPDMPQDFTICASYMVMAWKDFTSAFIFELRAEDGEGWAHLSMSALYKYTQFAVKLGKISFSVKSDNILFPLTWIHMCVSLETVSGSVSLIVDGSLLKKEVHRENRDDDEGRPANLDIVLGYRSYDSSEYTGMLSQLNIFSSPLSTARMVAMSTAGVGECGAPGDYVNWEEEDWTLSSMARREMVGELEGPCRRESKVTVYSADFELQKDCMDHCQKVGQGRSPPVGTLEEWDWLRKEVQAVTPDISVLPYLWLAATDEEVEGEWRDAYTGQKLDAGVAWPWWDVTNKDTTLGKDGNCLLWYTDEPDDKSWREWYCYSYYMACPCQCTQQPILLLRGLCKNSALKIQDSTQYTPKQLAGSPNDVFLVGQHTTQIRYNDTSKLWLITNAVSSVKAESMATKLSYVLGKHEWTVTDDVSSCSDGQTYKTLLKLSGCNPDGEFTCNNGQCVTMEQRCNQIPNCRDKSDEVNCKLLVLENNYNKKIPPIVPTVGDEFNATNVGISISLLKIVSMQEVLHKIDLQFEISLEWKENRVTYHNLKIKTSLNALTDAEVRALWLPYVIYANTDMKEAVQLDDGVPPTTTTIVVTKEGNFTRSGIEVIDETEIFEGKDNRLLMYQTYTKSFQCNYHLHLYPFDTQVFCCQTLAIISFVYKIAWP